MLLTYNHTAHTGHNMNRVDDFVRNACAYLNIEADEIVITFGDLRAPLPAGVEKNSGTFLAGSMRRVSEKTFEVCINSTVRTGIQVIALAHELVHVEQFTSGRFSSLGDGKGWMWEGQYYPPETPYKERPWEVEAHAKEYEVADAA